MKYKNRYTDRAEQNCYMNACDCLYYGYDFNYLNTCGVEMDRAKTIWEQAQKDLLSF